LLFLSDGVAGQSTTQLLEDFAVDLGEHDSRVYLTATQTGQLLQGLATLFVVLGQHAEGYQHLVSMQARILATQIFYLGLLDWFYQTLWNQLGIVVDACQMLGGVEQQSR
jgi:hypothetical protein